MKNRNNQELSEMFIGDDGLLSQFIDDQECEIIRIDHHRIIGDVVSGKIK